MERNGDGTRRLLRPDEPGSGGASKGALGLGNVEAALSLLPEAAERWPDAPDVQYLWGRALEIQEEPVGALEHLRRAAR